MTTHHFEPARYYNTLGWHEPALRIADGDSVVTTTVDARGADASGESITRPGNPMTGPFFVEGAEPGDTLAVTFDRITPNRGHGWTRKMVAANVVDPNYTPELPWPQRADDTLARWDIDVAAGTATLNAPDTTLNGFSLPLNPMLGCFGVAPLREQAISTATSAEHGGNMDYNGYVSGVTAYFPVFAPGALFHLGDGHALQGDGEIVGTGIEISMEVQFSVRVLRDKRSYWPRGESADYIFTAGNARPLDQATQHATTEMLRWLQADYGFDNIGASTFLGQCVEYDLGNIYDPAYTMICKVAKRLLPGG